MATKADVVTAVTAVQTAATALRGVIRAQHGKGLGTIHAGTMAKADTQLAAVLASVDALDTAAAAAATAANGLP